MPGTTARRGNLMLSSDLSRAARQLWVTLVLLALLMLVAASFYLTLESQESHTPWTLVDAIYMAVITITTIGFGEVHPLSQLGRAFTTGFAIVGIGLAAFAVRSAASLILGQQFSDEVQRRRRLRAVSEMRNHYVVCGYGRMGREAAAQLRRRGESVVVIEQDAAALEPLRAEGALFVEGNATQDEHLRSAGVDQAKCLVAAVATDEDNLFVVLSARLLNPNLHIVARAAQEATVDKLMRAGANRVLSPYVVGGRTLASAAAQPGVLDFLEMVLHRDEMDVEIASIAVPADSRLVGKTVSDAAVIHEGGAMILAIISAQGQFYTNPRTDRTVIAGDRLIAMGSRAQLAALQEATRPAG